MAAADEESLKGPLWDFALRFYALPGVAPACLDLQDRFDLDVPLMIAALYARLQGRLVDRDAITALDSSTANWRDEAIRPLRAIRRNLKASPWMATHLAVPPLRDKIKALELLAEQIQLNLLEHAVAGLRSDDRLAAEKTLSTALLLIVQHFTDADVDLPQSTVSLLTKAAESSR